MSTTNAIANRSGGALQQQPTEGQKLAAYLESDVMKKKLAMALPKHMSPERMIRMVLTAAARTPLLLKCDFNSIWLSLLTASQLGLEINGRDAHLVPFNSKKGYQCQLIPDYKGLIQLAYRSGVVRSIDAKAVYEMDDFEYELGSNSRLYHKPSDCDDPGNLTHAWAMVRLQNGGEKFVVLNSRDIKRHMASSKSASGEDSIWRKHPEAMWCKSAIKELAKWMPQTAELLQFNKAIEQDNSADCATIDVIPSKTTQVVKKEYVAPIIEEIEPPFNPPTAEEIQQAEAPRQREPGDDDDEPQEDAGANIEVGLESPDGRAGKEYDADMERDIAVRDYLEQIGQAVERNDKKALGDIKVRYVADGVVNFHAASMKTLNAAVADAMKKIGGTP